MPDPPHTLSRNTPATSAMTSLGSFGEEIGSMGDIRERIKLMEKAGASELGGAL